MARIKIMQTEDGYIGVNEDGTEFNVKRWDENKKDKDGNIKTNEWLLCSKNQANRKYVSLKSFEENKDADNTLYVDEKVGGPRTLGVSRPYTKLIPFMTEENKATYEAIMNAATAAKIAAEGAPKRKFEDLSREEQIAHLQAVIAGEKPQPVGKVAKLPLVDYISAEDMQTLQGIANEAEEVKKDRPRAARKPLTAEQKEKMAAARVAKEKSKAQELLDALLANG